MRIRALCGTLLIVCCLAARGAVAETEPDAPVVPTSLDELRSDYLGNVEAVRSVEPKAWLAFAQAHAGGMDWSTRAELVRSLCCAFDPLAGDADVPYVGQQLHGGVLNGAIAALLLAEAQRPEQTRMLLERLSATRLTEPQMIRALPPRGWLVYARHLRKQMTAGDAKRWHAAIMDAFEAGFDRGAELELADLFWLRQLDQHLGGKGKRSGVMAAGWLAAGERAGKLNLEEAAFVADNLWYADPFARFEAIHHLQPRWLEAWRRGELSATACRRLGNAWFHSLDDSRENSMLPDIYIPWNIRMLIAHLRDPDAASEHERRLCAGTLANRLPPHSNELDEFSVLTALARQAVAAEDTRMELWKLTAPRLKASSLRNVHPDAWEALEKVLAGVADDPDMPERILSDLAARVTDYRFLPHVRRLLDNVSIRQATLAPSRDAAAAVSGALKAQQDARDDEAIAGYLGVVDVLSDRPRWAHAVRRTVLRLCLKSPKVDLARRQLRQLDAARQVDAVEKGNYELRVLLAEVRQSAPAARDATWRKGIASVSVADGVLLEPTIRDLERTVAVLPDGKGGPTPGDMLSDVLLLAPDIPSMRRVLRLRGRDEIKTGIPSHADTTFAMETALSAVTADGPLVAARTLAAEIPGDADQRARLVDRVLPWGGLGARDDGATPPDCIDGDLRVSATALLDGGAGGMTARRRAWLHLFAGRADAAATHLCEHLCQCSGDQARRALDEAGVLAILAAGDLRAAHELMLRLVADTADAEDEGNAARLDADSPFAQFCQSMRDCARSLPAGEQDVDPQADTEDRCYALLSAAQRRAFLEEAVDAWDLRWIAWAGQAVRSGQTEWAARLCARMINAASDARQAGVRTMRVTQLLDRVDAPVKPRIDVLRRIVAHLAEPDMRYRLRVILAQKLLSDGDPDECIAVLDDVTSERAEDLTAGVLRVRALIEAGRLDEAERSVEPMAEWKGGWGLQAEALFLKGWLRLKAGDEQAGLAALRSLEEKRYANTPAGKKARQVLDRLDGK